MSTDTTYGRSHLSLSEHDLNFLSMFASGATLERLGRELMGLEGSYMSVCGRAHRYRNHLLRSLGLDPSLPSRVLRSQVQDILHELSNNEEVQIQGSGWVPQSVFASRVRYLQEALGLPNRPVKAPGVSSSFGDYQKILVLSDLHVPFQCEDLLLGALQDHKDAHTVVILGDFMDMYSASRFARSRYIDPLDEMSQAAAILELLATRFPRVVVLEGNHDSRAQRWLQTNRPEIAPLLLHPFEYLQYVWDGGGIRRRYANVEFPMLEVNNEGRSVVARHLFRIGDALLGHFERSLKGPGRTVHGIAADWLAQWEHVLFEPGSIRVLVQAHVHRLAKMQWGRLTLFECGCIADIMQYVMSSPAYHPPQMGYVVLYQRNGVTDVNLSNYFFYDYHREVRYGS